MTDSTVSDQFLLLYVTAPDGEPWSEEDDDIADWVDVGTERGNLVIGERLPGIAESRMVAKRDGEVTITDGPYAEFKEWFGGFDLVNARDLDDALEIASRHPAARYGRVLVVPLMSAVESNELFEATRRARGYTSS